jgi:hypothetical protein
LGLGSVVFGWSVSERGWSSSECLAMAFGEDALEAMSLKLKMKIHYATANWNSAASAV